MRKFSIALTVALAIPSAALAQGPDPKADEQARAASFCQHLSQIITTQRNAAEDQLASAAAQIGIMSNELNATKALLADAKKKIADMAAEAQPKQDEK